MSEKAKPLSAEEEAEWRELYARWCDATPGEDALAAWEEIESFLVGEAMGRVLATLDAARERIAEMEARERKLFGALRAAHGALALVHRGLVAGHVKAKAIIPREGPITSLEARVEQAMLAIATHLSPSTPAAPEMPADCHPQGE